jgi:hypothetical protein
MKINFGVVAHEETSRNRRSLTTILGIVFAVSSCIVYSYYVIQNGFMYMKRLYFITRKSEKRSPDMSD